MQTAQPLSAVPIRPKGQTDQREQTTAATSTDNQSSFRSKMERAEQKTAETAEPQQNVEAVSDPEEDAMGAMDAIEEQTWVDRLEAAVLPEEAKAMENPLPLTQTKEKQPGEDVPAECEAQMAILTALLIQPGSENQAALSVETENVAAEVQKPIMAAQMPEIGKKTEEPVVPAADLSEHEIILPEEAPQPGARTAQTAEQQPRERNTSQMPARSQPEAPAFGPAEISHDPVDLMTVDGELLPEKEAGQVLTSSLFEQVQSAVSTGKQELYVELKPESLGRLVIHLSMTEEGLKAQVRTGSESVQHLVTGQIYQLEDALRARDIQVVQMDVIYDQAAGSGSFNQHRQSWQESGRGGRGTFTAPIEETAGLYEMAAVPIGETDHEGVVYSA